MFLFHPFLHQGPEAQQLLKWFAKSGNNWRLDVRDIGVDGEHLDVKWPLVTQVILV